MFLFRVLEFITIFSRRLFRHNILVSLVTHKMKLQIQLSLIKSHDKVIAISL